MIGRCTSNIDLLTCVCEVVLQWLGKKGKDENTAISTKWNKCPLALVMEGQMF